MADNRGMDDWVNELDQQSTQQTQSREYQRFQRAAEEEEQNNWYERYTAWAGSLFKAEPFEDIQQDLTEAIAFLNLDVDEYDVTPASLIAMVALFIAVVPLLIVSMPIIFKFIVLVIPVAAFGYITFYPMIQAKRKLIESSSDMIMATLYMVIYMRSSPNIEGAVRFVAQNMDGPVANDFRRMLWGVQVGSFTSVSDALDEYKEVWFPYNRSFVETINIIQSALQEGRRAARDKLFQEAIDNLLSSTEHRMKEYSRELKTPVMFVQGMGVLLPVLLMILFPLVSAFIGGSGLGWYLFAGYNIILPVTVYLVMQQVVLSRPPTTSTSLVDSDELPEGGRYTLVIGGETYHVPLLPVCLVLFLLLGAWPLQHYLSVVFTSASLTAEPGTYEIFRSLVMTIAVALPTSIYLFAGYKPRQDKQQSIKEIEEEFPQALYMLGDALGRGSPIEIAIDKAVKNMQGMDITAMFSQISRNIRSMGMTFQQAIFDDRYGVLKQYPSQLIESVMEAIQESAGKGTEIVSSAMKTISNYLNRVRETQENIEDMMADTLSTMTFISYVLAPVIAGIAVGMGSVITTAFSQIGDSFSGVGNVTEGGADTGAGAGGPVSGVGETGAGFDPSSIFSFESSLSPEIIQLVVGLYFIQLAFLLGSFYTKLSKGENTTSQYVTTGRILLVGVFLYSLTVLILTSLFGSIVSGVG